MSFLAEYSGELNLAQTALSELELSKVVKLGEMTIVRFQQRFRDVAILGAEASVGVDGRNAPYQVTVNSVEHLPSINEWVVDAERAIESARQAKEFVARDTILADRFWLIRADHHLRAIYRIVVPATDPLADWEFIIDGSDGSVLSIKDLLHRAEGYVYNRNPILDGPNASRVSLSHLTSASNLTGQFAKVYSYLPNLFGLVSLNTPVQLASPDSNGNYSFGPNDPRFDEVELYSAIDDVHARFASLGFNLLDRPIEAMTFWPDASVQGPFYTSASFGGRGGIFIAPIRPRYLDPSWDADVVFHEYTHAVVHAVVGDTRSPEFGALNEAFADYFSASFHSDPNIAAFTAYAIGARFPYLRTLSNTTTYPADLSPDDPHISGLIWGGALWDIRGALGQDKADRVALLALAGLSGSSEFVDAALAVAGAARALYGVSVYNQVIAIMARRGILTPAGISAFLATELASAVPASGQIGAPQSTRCILDTANEFTIRVLPGSTSLLAALVSTSNLQVFMRYRQPVVVQNGNPVSDYQTPIGTQITNTVNLQSVPELQAGVYYLAVGNCNAFPVNYAIGAAFQGGSANGPGVLTSLSSGLTATGSTPAHSTNSRQFTIQVPANATALSVTAKSNTDVDLYVRYGAPVALGPEGMPLADAYAESASSIESITLSASTSPGLRPGTYYVAVKNSDGNQLATFSLTASVNNTPSLPASIRSITPDTPVQASIPQSANGLGVLSSTQFSIQVPENSTSLSIAASAVPNVVVFVRQGSPVGLSNGIVSYDYAFTPSAQPRFDVTSTGYPALKAGLYYIAIGSFAGTSTTLNITCSIAGAQQNIPQFTASGIVNAGAFVAGDVSPGEIVSIFGANFASGVVSARAAPLPTTLGGVSVTFNSIAAPLYFVSPGQINLQVPLELPGGIASVIVTTITGKSNTISIPVSAATPGFLTQNSRGTGLAVAVDAATGTLISPSTPVARGGIMTVYGVGFGPVSPAPATGAAASASPLAFATSPITVFIGDQQAKVPFVGLAPGYVGLYQLNIEIPSNVQPGSNIAMSALVNSKRSNFVELSIR